MSYLFEPYNAWQKPPKKKHWTEIAEEEALFVKMQLEESARRQSQFEDAIKHHLALREASARANLNNQNLALPQYSPQPSSQQVQDGQYAAPAAGGGWVLPGILTQISELAEVASFTLSPSSGTGPLAVSFTNTSITPANDTFFWDFGSGSVTSTSANPGPLTYTRNGSYTVTLQETSSAGAYSTATQGITVSLPTITANFSQSNGGGARPDTINYFDTTIFVTSSLDTVVYSWRITTGSTLVSSSAVANPTFVFNTVGTYSASLAVTESVYGISSSLLRTGSAIIT